MRVCSEDEGQDEGECESGANGLGVVGEQGFGMGMWAWV